MNRMREVRKSFGFTLKELGKMVGVSEATMSNYETGKREPDFETLRKLADILEVSTDYLLGLTDNPMPTKTNDDDQIWAIRERLRRDPSFRLLFDAAIKAKPEHLKATAAMLKALEPPEREDAD